MTTTHSTLGRHWLRSLLMLLVLAHCLGLQAQQAQERRRCKTGFLLPEFSDAKIMQSFGRYVKAKANILIKGAALCYMEDGKVMKAKTDGIFGVNFGDTLRYVKVNGAMARVVAQKKYHQLLCDATRREPLQGGASGHIRHVVFRCLRPQHLHAA